jgi:endonuclease YncB( thermonuclease family)
MDWYGRIVAVGLQVSVDPGTWMVREGWALAYQAYGSHDLAQEASGRWPLALRRSSIAHTIAH